MSLSSTKGTQVAANYLKVKGSGHFGTREGGLPKRPGNFQRCVRNSANCRRPGRGLAQVGAAAPGDRPALLEQAKAMAAEVKEAEARQTEAEAAAVSATPVGRSGRPQEVAAAIAFLLGASSRGSRMVWRNGGMAWCDSSASWSVYPVHRERLKLSRIVTDRDQVSGSDGADEPWSFSTPRVIGEL